jgi:hypothetical protein
MSALRNTVVRASKAAFRPTITFRATARPLSTTPPLAKPREIISEKQIPVSKYTEKGTTPERSTIPVRPSPDIEVPVEHEEHHPPALNRNVYNRMSKTAQSMSIMDKVVIVTG